MYGVEKSTQADVQKSTRVSVPFLYELGRIARNRVRQGRERRSTVKERKRTIKIGDLVRMYTLSQSLPGCTGKEQECLYERQKCLDEEQKEIRK